MPPGKENDGDISYMLAFLGMVDGTNAAVSNYTRAIQKNYEMLKPIRKIKELAYKYNQQEIVEMSERLLSIFSLSDKKS